MWGSQDGIMDAINSGENEDEICNEYGINRDELEDIKEENHARYNNDDSDDGMPSPWHDC